MTKIRAVLLLLICSSIICVASLRPGSAVVPTVGRASNATAVKPLRLVEDQDRVFSLQASQPVVIEIPTTLPATTIPPTTTTQYVPPTTTTQPPPPPPPVQPEPAVSTGSDWDRLAECESGGNWQANTGNGYYGGIQFSLASWEGVGGTGYPHEHSRETQIEMGERLKAQGGWGHWPACSRELGLR